MILNNKHAMSCFGWLALAAHSGLLGATSSSTIASTAQIEAPAAAAIEELVVTGARRAVRVSDAVVGVEVMSRADIEASGAEDLAEVLEGQPGLQIERSFSGTSIRIQGLDPEHTLILVDGQRINGRINGVIDLQRLAAERIERVEVVKGSASALYGSDALAGVVNIITREGREPFSASVHSAFGSLSASRQPFAGNQSSTVDSSVRLAGRGKTWNLSVTGGYHRQDAFDLSPNDVATSGSSLESYNFEARGMVDVSKDISITTRFDYFDRRLAGIDLGPERSDVIDNPFVQGSGRAVYDRRNRQRSFSVSVQPRIELSRRSELQVSALFSRYDDIFELDQREQDVQDSRQETTDDLVQVFGQYVGQLGADHVLSAGIETLYERQSSERIQGGEGDRGRFSVYAQNEWRPFEDLAIVPGFRLDVDTAFGTYPTPKVAIRYDLTSSIVLRGSYGLGFRAPTLRDQFLTFENPSAGYRVVGNPNLDPETSRSLTVGAELAVFTDTVLRVEGYRNDVTNLIAFLSNPETIPGQPQSFTNGNIDSAVTQGFEVSLTMGLLGFLRADLAYTYLDARDTDSDRFLEGRARHRTTFAVRAFSRDVGLTAWVRGTYVGERPFYLPDANESGRLVQTQAEAYVAVDARVSQDIGQHLNVFVGVDNLLNAGDAQFLAIPPFGLYGGLNARL